jgi:hypothetical protein
MSTAFEGEFLELTRRKVLRGPESEFSKEKLLPQTQDPSREPMFQKYL